MWIAVEYMFVGFLEKEIVKDGIEILDMGENPEAPASREMSDLEVSHAFYWYIMSSTSNE